MQARELKIIPSSRLFAILPCAWGGDSAQVVQIFLVWRQQRYIVEINP
ncbi:hypothetical protein SB6424_01861 [Klebsiella pasteurii]|nr:hypothetical protein SB6424_01861 [Klebsiella pasteurii]